MERLCGRHDDARWLCWSRLVKPRSPAAAPPCTTATPRALTRPPNCDASTFELLAGLDAGLFRRSRKIILTPKPFPYHGVKCGLRDEPHFKRHRSLGLGLGLGLGSPLKRICACDLCLRSMVPMLRPRPAPAPKPMTPPISTAHLVINVANIKARQRMTFPCRWGTEHPVGQGRTVTLPHRLDTEQLGGPCVDDRAMDG